VTRSRIPISEPSIGEEEIRLVVEALETGWVSSAGPNIARFERLFADYCETSHAVTVCNGTAALHLALEVLGIGPGDEVIVPDLTFVATANAVVHAGATPVIVDVEPETLAIDPASFEAAITARTKAVIPVHLYGHPAPMDLVVAIAKKHGLWVIEDAAEAHGARWQGRRVGSWGDLAVFSFYGNKIITTGEGGMVTTQNAELADRMRFYRDHAMSRERRYFHPEVGWNYRMTNVQAAIGVGQMARIDAFVERRKTIFQEYSRHLANVPGIRLNRVHRDAESVFWMICVELADPRQRDKVMAFLGERGIDTRPYFIPLTAMPMYAPQGPRPVAAMVSASGFNLPSFFTLTADEIAAVSAALVDALRQTPR
jgi:perosamine synthetase